MDERVTKTPTPISVDLQAFQQLLATLMNTTDMEQRSNAERQLTMVMEQPLLACELLVSSIELDNQQSQMAEIILRRDQKRLQLAQVLCVCNQERAGAAHEYSLRLLQCLARRPTIKLAEIVSELAIRYLAKPAVYPFPEVSDFVAQAIKSDNVAVQRVVYFILKSLSFININTVQEALKLSLVETFLAGLNTVTDDKTRTYIVNGLSYIVSRGQNALDSSQRAAIRQRVMEAFVRTLSTNIDEANKQADEIQFLYDNSDIDQQEIASLFELIYQIINSSIEQTFKGKMITIIQTLMVNRVNIDEELQLKFTRDILLTCLTQIANYNDWQNDINDDYLITDNLIMACRDCLEMQSQHYGAEFLINLIRGISNENVDQQIVAIYYSLEFVSKQLNEQIAEQLLEQVIRCAHHGNELTIYRCIMCLSEFAYQCPEHILQHEQITGQTLGLLINTFTNDRYLLKTKTRCLQAILNIVTSMEIVQISRYTDDLLRICAMGLQITHLAAKSYSIGLLSSLTEQVEYGKLRAVVEQVVPSLFQDYQNFLNTMLNHTTTVEAGQCEYVSRIVECISFTLRSFPDLYSQIFDQVTQSYLHIIKYSVQNCIDGLIELPLSSLRRIAGYVDMSKYQTQFLEILTLTFNKPVGSEQREEYTLDVQRNYQIETILTNLPGIFERQNAKLQHIFSDIIQLLETVFIYEENASVQLFKCYVYCFYIAETMGQDVWEQTADVIVDAVSKFFDEGDTRYYQFSICQYPPLIEAVATLLNLLLQKYQQTSSPAINKQIGRVYELVKIMSRQITVQLHIELAQVQQDTTKLQLQAQFTELSQQYQDFFYNLAFCYGYVFAHLKDNAFEYIRQNSEQLSDIQDFLQLNWKGIDAQTLQQLTKNKMNTCLGIVANILEYCSQQAALSFLKEDNYFQNILEYYIANATGDVSHIMYLCDVIINYCHQCSFMMQNSIIDTETVKVLARSLLEVNDLLDGSLSDRYKQQSYMVQFCIVALQCLLQSSWKNGLFSHIQQIDKKLMTSTVMNYLCQLCCQMTDREEQVDMFNQIIVPQLFGEFFVGHRYFEPSTIQKTKDLIGNIQNHIILQNEMQQRNIEYFVRWIK